MKLPSFSFSKPAWLDKPWVMPVALIVGILIGVGGTYAVGRSFFSSEKLVENEIVSQEEVGQVEVVDSTVMPLNNHQDRLNITFGSRLVLDIDWQEPVEMSDQEIMDFFNIDGSQVTATNTAMYHDDAVNRMWMVGTVLSGRHPFEGDTLYLMRHMASGPGPNNYYQYFIKNEYDRVYAIHEISSIANLAELWLESAKMNVISRIEAYPYTTIAGINPEERVQLSNDKWLHLDTDGHVWYEEQYDFESGLVDYRFIGTTKDGQKMYERIMEDSNDPSAEGCIYLFGQDGKSHRYHSNIETVSVSTYTETPDIHWNRTMDMGDAYYYSKIQGGCGPRGCADLVSAPNVGALEVIGETVEGDAVYVSRDPASDANVQAVYDSTFVFSSEKESLDSFLENVPVPIFYWKDALDRWVLYRSSRAAFPGECGKPVIYLYPEEEIDAHVELPSFIDVTVSDPEYPQGGWDVLAKPSGELVYHADGKTYGSLYWEGNGVSYESPKEGFIVKDGEVESFFAETLPKYGLNKNETKEFMEFWVSKFRGAPYYRISFLTSAWSKAAPLYVTPRPQTSIRLFMDWIPLQNPISIPEPQIVTPSRDGFTLVEWGGLLYE